MKIKQLVVALLCTHYACGVSALQPLDEVDLAQATGQDGLSLGLHFDNAVVSYDQFILTSNGITGSTTHNKRASLVIAPETNSSMHGISLFKADGTASQKQINLLIDSDANDGKPVANMNLRLDDTARIRIDPFSIYLASGDTSIFSGRKVDTLTSNIKRTHVHEIVRVGAHGLDIVFKDNDLLGINIQLGNAAQGAMLKFTSGSLTCVANNNMCISGLDDDGKNPIQVFDSTGSSIKLGLKLSASDQTTGFRLYKSGSFGGFYSEVVDQGLLFAGNGTTDKLDLKISNLTIGEAGERSGTVFNNLKNGSIGNIGMNGMSITDFKMTVSGM